MNGSIHIVLMGDSIFDNRTYTGGGPAVIDQVSELLGSAGQATLVARDGDRVSDLRRQIKRVPPDASHVVVSAGGNDALDHYSVLDEATGSVAGTMLRLSVIVDDFEELYRKAIGRVRRIGADLTICTIYNGHFTDPVERRVYAHRGHIR